jgi:hypothetical protein
MTVELEWRFDDEVPHEIPREEYPPRRPRRRVWLRLAGAVLLSVGVGLYVWWCGRREALATVEAEVQAVAQLELRALAEGDTELYLGLQNDADPNWHQAQQARAAGDALLPPPLPGLTSTAAYSVENARVVGDAARVEVVRMAGLPGGEMAPFRAVRFYRRNDDGRWLHTRADPDYTGHVIIWSGQRVKIVSFAADRDWVGPIASELESLAERFCSFAGIVPCQHRVPLTVDFTGTLDTAVEPEGVLPAPFVVGTPDDEAARAVWEVGVRELLFEHLIVRETGQSLASDQGWPRSGEVFRARLHQWLRAEVGLSEPISPDLDLIGEALDAGDWIPLGALWHYTFADDDDRRRLAEAEIDLLLAFIAEEYGRSQVARPLHALRLVPRLEALIWQALGETWPNFEHRHAAYVREVTGRPFEPLGEAAPFAEYDLVATCEGPSSLWGLRLDRPEMAPLLASAGFSLHSWAPDGARLLVWRGAIRSGLYLLEADGTGVSQLTSAPEGAWMRIDGWSPDGRYVACPALGQSLEGGLVDVEADERVVLDGHSFAWSPDGSHLAYVASGPGPSVVWLAQGNGSHPRQVGGADRIAWSPDGTQIACAGMYDGSLLRTYDVTTGGTTILLDRSTLYGLLGTQFAPPFVGVDSVAWSPAGEWIGFAVGQVDEVESESARGAAMLIRPDGSDARVLLVREGDVDVAGWSPDGRWMTCDTHDGESSTTTVIGIDGTVLLEANGTIAWSPDGRYLAVVEQNQLRILELGSATWYPFEPPARCGTAMWNPRGPLHEPTPGRGHVTSP